MAKLLLTQRVIQNIESPHNKTKIDLFDTQQPGLMLEVRRTGGKTYYCRYQNARSKIKQYKLGNASDLTLAQARQLCQKVRSQVLMGNDPAEQKAALKTIPTVREFAYEHYLPYVKTYKKTWGCDESLLRNHILPAIGQKHLDQVTKKDIIDIHHGRRNAGAAVGSANRLLVLLRYMFNLAIRWELYGLEKNPTANVPLFSDPPKKERYLSEEEAKRLYEALMTSQNKMLRYIIPSLLLTGARKQEVLQAKWKDFDLRNRLWCIPISKSGAHRYVPISDVFYQLLLDIPKIDGCEYVFANPKTQKPYVSIFYPWDTARKKAGLAEVRIHDLRHSFASYLVNNGRSLYEVQMILGHSEIKTTQRYAHLSQETLLAAANTAVNSLGDTFMRPATIERIGTSSVV